MNIDPNNLPDDPLPRLRELMRLLRGPAGCPWDRQQDHRSLRPHLLEETWEVLAVLDGIPEPDDERLCDELGDLLLQVVFHAQIADERGAFDLDGVAGHIGDKLVRRHPHVFGDTEVDGSAQVLANWEAIKRQEGVEESPTPLPALLDAERTLSKAERSGLGWTDTAQARAKVGEELSEVEAAIVQRDPVGIEAEFGDLLLAVVSWGRRLGVDPESALRGAVRRFRERTQSPPLSPGPAGSSGEDTGSSPR